MLTIANAFLQLCGYQRRRLCLIESQASCETFLRQKSCLLARQCQILHLTNVFEAHLMQEKLLSFSWEYSHVASWPSTISLAAGSNTAIAAVKPGRQRFATTSTQTATIPSHDRECENDMSLRPRCEVVRPDQPREQQCSMSLE